MVRDKRDWQPARSRRRKACFRLTKPHPVPTSHSDTRAVGSNLGKLCQLGVQVDRDAGAGLGEDTLETCAPNDAR